MGEQILLIEDDPAVRAMLSRALDRAGYRVLTADNGRSALAGHSLTTVDLVISDVQMPEMDGIEVVQAVRQRVPDLPILMLSGAWTGLLQDAELLGANAALEKPVSVEELLATVRRLLNDSGRRAADQT